MSHSAVLQPDRRVPTGARRAVISAGLRHLARKMETSHPALNTPGHLRDAARELDRGNTEGAQRHLRAGIGDLQPVNLYRHGITDDLGHTGARQHLTSIHRQLLNVKDVEDATARHRAPLPGGGPSFAPSAIEGEAVTPGYKTGSQAMNAPGKPPVGRSDRAAERPRAPSTPNSKQQTYAAAQRAILLSAQTARLAVTPAPRGKPGGPGLYGVKGLGHTDYYNQIVKALIEKRGMPPGRAYAIARAAIRRWGHGGGKVHPEVRAAAAAAEAGEVARQGIAHAHSWADLEAVIELATIDLGGPGSGNPNQQRGPGGKFTAASGGSGAGKHPPGHPARTAAVAKNPAGSMNRAQRAHMKSQLQAKARAFDQQAHQLSVKIHSLILQLRAGSGPAGAGKSSAAAGAGKSSAAGGAAAASSPAASSSSAASSAAGSSSSAASKSSAPTSTGISSGRSAAQINAKITQLRQQEHALRAKAAAAKAQASKL